jgi:hypothetical protein
MHISLSSASAHGLVDLLRSDLTKLVVLEHSSQVGHDLLLLGLVDAGLLSLVHNPRASSTRRGAALDQARRCIEVLRGLSLEHWSSQPRVSCWSQILSRNCGVGETGPSHWGEGLPFPEHGGGSLELLNALNRLVIKQALDNVFQVFSGLDHVNDEHSLEVAIILNDVLLE